MPSASESIWIAVTVLVAVAAATGGVWGWRRLKDWHKDPEELERQRRMDVNRRGRIAAGELVDIVEPEAEAKTATASGPAPILVVYKYEVAGVTYEVSQDVSRLAAARFCSGPGLALSVKYDPRTPANSIVACEDWCGLLFQ